MEIKNFIKRTLILIGIILFFGIICYPFYLTSKTSNMCEDRCNDYNSIAYEVIRNGDFNLDDTCVCFFKDSVKVFKLGDYIESEDGLCPINYEVENAVC